ncbi:MAG TPA: hypothetical protein VFX48_01120, partial [Saprospiraceae bacterium]|nr:hypothetical protein [Saprospiraceae bacterium]
NTVCATKTELTPDVTGRPEIIGADKCNNIIQTYDDIVFTLDPDACLKILRKWIVIDWCLYNPNDKNPKGYWTWTQVIKVLNSVPPTFLTSCADRTVDVFGPGCAGQVTLVASAVDDCTDSTDLVWTHQVDLYNNGIFDSISPARGRGKNASGVYPIGVHRVIFRVKDACNNESVCSFLLTVRDGKKPTPYCIGHIVTTVMPSSQSIEIWAKDFNLNSEDNCTPKDSLKYYFLVNGRFVPSMVFTCSNIGNNILRIYVEDKAGNSDYCEATLEIQDPNNVCPTGLTIQGKIATINNKPVKGVSAIWDRPTPLGTNVTYTDANGIYSFHNLTSGMTYNIRAERNSGYANGISTYDIVLIQRHILGLQLLNSPYLHLAADVNGSCTITAADISEIRKLILGKISAFSQSPSWKFVPVNSVIPSGNNPCGFEHQLNYNLISRNEMNADFYGIKMGDINLDGDGSNFQSGGSRTGQKVRLYSMEAQLSPNTTTRVPVYATDVMGLEGLQMAFDWDPTAMQLTGIESGQIQLTDDQYVIRDGQLLVALENGKDQEIDALQPLFTLVVEAKLEAALSRLLRLNPSVLRAEWYDQDLNIHPMEFGVRGSVKEAGEELAVLYQNKPNPFHDATQIGFELSKDQEVEFIFYEMDGKVIHRVSKTYAKGYHELEVKKSELNTFGVLFVQMNTESFTDTKRIILIR